MIAPQRLPRLLSVLVVAFAGCEGHPLLKTAELLRGMTIQLAYRWPLRQVCATRGDEAVLLWSVSPTAPSFRRLPRHLLAVLVATTAGMAMVLIVNAMLLVPLGAVLRAAGVGAGSVELLSLSVVGVRLAVTLWRAVCAYCLEASLTSLLPATDATRWRIDYLAAVPSRTGSGGRLLAEFLRLADDSDAEVVLHCDGRVAPFYGRHGFHLVDTGSRDGQHLMTRPPLSERKRTQRHGHRHPARRPHGRRAKSSTRR